MTTNPVAAWTKTAFTTTNPTTYKAQIDANSVVATRFVDQFAPFQSAVPNMTITVDPGHLFDGTTLTEVAQQISGTITAPTGSNKRIDRAVVDNITGVLSIVTGTPTTGTPAAPAIPAGKTPVAQIGTTGNPLLVSTTAITNSMIVDERDLSMLGKNINSQQTIASATTTDLGSKSSNNLSITGAVTITALGSSASLANPLFQVTFTGAPLLTYNASSLKLPGNANIQAQAGDSACFLYTGSGNWTCLEYQRANGQTITPFGAEVSLASNTTTDLGAQVSNQISITGTTAITSFGSNASVANPLYFLRFTGILTLTNNGVSLILPGGLNITTASGDSCIALYLGSGNWKIISYTTIAGTPLISSGVAYNAIAGCFPTAMSGNHTTAAITISSGQAADSTNTAYLVSAGYSWAAANGNAINGTDAAASTLANSTTYHMYLISGASGTGTFCSASLTPTFPAGYTTYKRRIFSFNTTAAGAPIPYKVVEAEGGSLICWLVTQLLDISTAAQTTSRILYPLTVPSGIKVMAFLRVMSGTSGSVIFTSGDETDVAPGAYAGTAAPGYDLAGNTKDDSQEVICTTDTSGQIGARASVGTYILAGTTRGFKDFRRS